jgi:hypothetical protein
MYIGYILSDNGIAKNLENFWQYSKVYQKHLDENGNPTPEYFKWKTMGYNKDRADRYPMGKGKIPLYSWYCGEKSPYIEARTKIYMPYYAEAVKRTDAFKTLVSQWQDCLNNDKNLILLDFDAYDHRKLGYTWNDILNDPKIKMGHAFFLAKVLSDLKLTKLI